MPITKSDLLMQYCKQKKVFSKVDIYEWGIKNYFISAVRVVQKWAETNKIRRLSKEEKLLRGLVKRSNQNIAWWEV